MTAAAGPTAPLPGWPADLDAARMRRERRERLLASTRAAGVDVLVLLGQSNVVYATGARVPAADAGLAAHRRMVAVVTADGAPPHLATWCPEGVPADLPAEHVHPGLDLEAGPGAAALAALVDEVAPGATVALDEATMPVWAVMGRRRPVDAGPVLAAAKVVKTADERACVRRAQAINEAAMADVEAMVTPGLPATELSGRFLRRVFELGASANTVDPIFQVMPRSIADGPFSATGDVVFPTPTTTRPLEEGDVVWVDTGICYEGYQSDFGTTWVVGGGVDAHHRAQFAEWRAVTDRVLDAIRPGATARDLTRAAGEAYGRQPWLAHLYLAHGTGTDSAEMPLVGTDLGPELDEAIVLEPGMVLVLEPVAWDDGHAGFRAEEIVAVTDDGWEPLHRMRYDAHV